MTGYPSIILTTETPIHGYWDGGAKHRFEFTADHERTDSKGVFVKWGSWNANFWFHAGKGKTPRTAAAYAIKRLKKMYNGGVPCKFEIVD